MVECEACEKAGNKIVSVEKILKDSPLFENFSSLIEKSLQRRADLNALLLGNECVYDSERRLCINKNDVENVEKKFFENVRESFTQFFDSEANVLHWLYAHEPKQMKRLAPDEIAARFGDFHYARNAFEDLEKKLMGDADGGTEQEGVLRRRARHASDAAGILSKFSEIYEAPKERILDELLIAEGRHHKTLLHQYAIMLNNKTVARKGEAHGSFSTGILASLLASGMFLVAGEAHLVQQPVYESFRNAVASLSGIRDLSAPLGIPAEFLLSAGMSLFFAQSMFGHIRAQAVRRKAYLNELQNCAGEFKKSLLRNAEEHVCFYDGNLYARMPLPQSGHLLEFRMENDNIAVMPDGSTICNRKDGQNFEALRGLYFLARNCSELSGGLKSGFDAKKGIATYIFKDGAYIRYELGFLGRIEKVGGDATLHGSEYRRELQEFYFNSRAAAELAATLPPVPTIMLYQPVRSPDANYIVVKDGAGNELAKLIYGKASALVLPANVFLPVDILVDLGRNVVWDSRKTTTGKLPLGVDPVKVIRTYKEEGWQPVIEFKQQRLEE